MEYLVVSLMFIVFLQTRFVELRRATLCLALQSALIAAACLVVGMSHGSGLHAWLPGVLTIAVKVLFIPYAILRVVNQLRDEREIVSDINVNYSTAFAACSLALGYMVIDGLLPQAEVIYLHYSDEAQTEYDNRMDMQEPVISILDKLTERIRTYNRLTNVQVGLFRLEVYDFSEAVFQEALLNALAHRSYEDMAPIYVKHYPTKIVIENPGGFPGDINESNIITHQSIPRNKLIAMTLQHLKYVQRSGQGVDIMFQSMLTEGKPYPEYASTPNSVRLTLRSTMENQNFVRFIAETQDKRSKMFTLSELMILHYLREHQKITLKQAAKTIQETDDNAHKVLNALRDEGLLELNGKTYMLSLKVYETVKTDVAYVQDKTVSQIQAKDRILEYLKHKPSITNQKAQELCGFNKNQTYYILHQMCKDGILQPDGVGRGTKYKSVK